MRMPRTRPRHVIRYHFVLSLLPFLLQGDAFTSQLPPVVSPRRLPVLHALSDEVTTTTTTTTTTRTALTTPASSSSSSSSSSPPPLDSQTLSCLLGASAFWGTYPTCVKLLYQAGPAFDPSVVVLLRFCIMAAVGSATLVATTPKFTLLRRYAAAKRISSGGSGALPWADQLERRVPASVYLAALELGLLGGAGTFFQTLSLTQIPALTAAVLYSTVNVFTPALASFAGADEGERQVSGQTWAGCVVGLLASAWALVPDDVDLSFSSSSLAAVALFDGSGGGGGGGSGALIMLLASACYASTKVRLSSHLRYHGPEEIAAGRLVAQAGAAAAGLGLLDETSAVHELLPAAYGGLGESLGEVGGQLGEWVAAVTPAQAGLLLASSLLSGAGATLLQSRAQRRASAPQAQLWFALTPAFGACWAAAILGEQLTFHEVTGAAVLLAAIVLSIPPAPQKEQLEQ